MGASYLDGRSAAATRRLAVPEYGWRSVNPDKGAHGQSNFAMVLWIPARLTIVPVLNQVER